MKKLIVIVLLIGAVLPSCKKNTSAAKIDRHIEGETWRVAKIIDNAENRSTEFTNYTFRFTTEKVLSIVMPDSTFVGTWDRLEEKNPARLILSTALVGPTSILGDDWNVVFLTKDEFRLERFNGQKKPTDELIFRKI